MKILKRISLLSLLLVMLVTLSACGGTQEEDTAATPDEAQKVTIKMAHTEAEDRTIHLACVEFKKWIEEASKGNITVELYPNGSISGSDADLAEAAATGTIEISVSATSALTNYSDKFGILDMPYLFNNEQCAFNAIDGKLGETLNATLAGTGLKILGYSYNGVRNTTNNVRPINEPNDFNGIKMRTMQSPTHIATFKAFGSNATPMSFGEVYTGLQQGTVQGQDNAASLIYAQQFYEVQKYLSLTQHNYGFMAVIANENWYNSLSEENRALVDQGIKDYMLDYERNLEMADNDSYIKKLEEKGMAVNSITPENHQKFVDIVQPVYAEYAKTFGQDLFDIALSYNK
ncbi:MAG: TRAP transporter substrate-binding protein [Dehalobacterium sp.]